MCSTDADENLAELLSSAEGIQFVLNESERACDILWDFVYHMNEERGRAITENRRFNQGRVLDIAIQLMKGIEREAKGIAQRVAHDEREKENRRDSDGPDREDDDSGSYGICAISAIERRGVTGYAEI